MKKIYYHKLIRDKVPAKILNKGSKLETKTLNQKQFQIELRKKLAEEGGGVASAKTRQELIEELVDTQTVLDEIKRTNKITAKEMLAATKLSMGKKGGFKKRIYLVWSSDDNYKSNERKGKK